VTSVLVAPALQVRRRLAGTRGLAVNGGALAVNVVASGLTGLAFWILAARVASPATVSRSSTAVNAIIAVVSLSQQSFVFTLPSLLAVSPRPRRLVGGVYAVALAITALAAPLYIVVGPHLFGGLTFLRDGRLAVAFVASALVWCVFSLQDAVLTGVRRAGVVLAENTAWGLARLALVVGLWAVGVRLGVGWLVASWLVPALVLVVGVSWFLFVSPSSPLARPLGTQRFDRRRFLSFMGAEYAASVLSSIVTLVGGAFALTTFGARGAAPFVTAAALVIVVENALASFAQALAVEACRPGVDRTHRRNLLALTGGLLGAVSFVAVGGALLFGHTVMGLLGDTYRGPGGTALGIMMLCVPARAVAVVSNADNRLRGDGARNLLQQVVACVVIFGLLLSGRIDTVPALCWAVVAMRVVPALLAVHHLRAGRLRTSVG
jgi:hypothetical protein